MQISEFTLKLIILLIPGGIASIIFEKLTIHKKWDAFQFVANSILMGGISYMVAQIIFDDIFDNDSFVSFWKNLPLKDIPFIAIIESTCISFFVGYLGAGMDNYKLINRLGTFLKLSTKYGDENLYSYFLNNKDVFEIYIRDLSTNQTYQGFIVSFSETDSIKEIVLRDVKVYHYETSDFLYDIKLLYLSRSKDLLSIEVLT